MTTEEIENRLAFARKTLYYTSASKFQLEGAIKNVITVKASLDSYDLKVADLLAKLYYTFGDYNAAIKVYNEMLEIDASYSPLYLGLYKCLIASGNTEKIFDVFNMYKETLGKKINGFDSTLLDFLNSYLVEDTNNKVINTNKYMYFVFKNKKMNDLYNKLIELVNSYRFEEARLVAIELDDIAKNCRLLVEFNTLAKLLRECSIVLNKRNVVNLKNSTNKLNEAVNNNDVLSVRELLFKLSRVDTRNPKLIIKALYVLISNGYLEDATSLLEIIEIPKSYKEQVKILKTGIIEHSHINNLSVEEKEVYDEAIIKGRESYHKKDFEEAFDYYTWGLLVTRAPIFYYYIGKILYKLCRYREAREYFENYITMGVIKIDKAYLYLSKIAEKYGKKKKSVSYSKYVSYANDVLNKEFDYHSIYEDEENFDLAKNNASKGLHITEYYFVNPKYDLMREYMDYIKSGSYTEADQLLDEIIKKEDKSEEDKLILRMIQRNKTLFENKRV